MRGHSEGITTKETHLIGAVVKLSYCVCLLEVPDCVIVSFVVAFHWPVLFFFKHAFLGNGLSLMPASVCKSGQVKDMEGAQLALSSLGFLRLGQRFNYILGLLGWVKQLHCSSQYHRLLTACNSSKTDSLFWPLRSTALMCTYSIQAHMHTCH